MKQSAKAIAAFAWYLLATSTDAYLYEQVVQTKNGPVQGAAAFNSTSGPAANFSNWETISVFKGIPYAASTAGANRWRAPQPPAAWNETLVASAFGDECPSLGVGDGVSEDCLSVNIWTPANSTGEKLPVAIWSYGAGTTSANDNFNGAGMAAAGVVFVT